MTGQEEEEEEEKVEEQATPSKPLDFGSPDMDGNNNGRPQGQQQHDEEASYAVSEDSSSSCSVEAAPIQPISFQSVLSSQEGSTRSQNQPRSSKRAVFLRSQGDMDAMGNKDRAKAKMLNMFKRVTSTRSLMDSTRDARKEDDQEELDPEESRRQTQYRLESNPNVNRSWLWRCFCGWQATAGNLVNMGLSPNQSLAMSLHWMFRVNFFFLFAMSCIVFFALTIFFAGFIIAAGRLDPECVRIGGDKFESAGTTFADAFALSWTTFSTVGYGSTYPALSHENQDPSNCLFITAVCSLEAFVGVLYSGFCGAVLFGKVLRIQSHAQVIFSDPLIIRYGQGVEVHETGDDDSSSSDSSDDESDLAGDAAAKKKKKQDTKNRVVPCPVLEFRIVNRLFNEVGGEIMDATLNVVANVDADDADLHTNDSVGVLSLGSSHPHHHPPHHVHPHASNHSGHHFPWLHPFGHHDDHPHHPHEAHHDDHHGNNSHHHHHHHHHHESRLAHLAYALMGKRHEHHVDEDPTSRLVSKRIFSKLTIEACDHPFFKRVWLARHILDETSPVLIPRVRRMIRKNHGHWPPHLNHWKRVRESLRFNQIVVSLNGVSNVSASDVYAQKIYDFVDVNVGYQFVNLLYQDGGKLRVDTDLINDVREQNGGGGEPLTVEE